MKFNDMGYTRMEMSLNTYQHLSKRTLPTGKHSEGLTNYALGLGGEGGEVIDHIKKHVFHGHDLDDEKVKGELGDVMHYVAGLCTMLGYTLEEVCTMNVEKLMKRFPNGFNSADSKKRVDTIKTEKIDGLSPDVVIIDELSPHYQNLTQEQLNEMADKLYRATGRRK